MKQQCNWYKNNSHERSGRAQFVSLLKSVSKEEPSHMACFRGNLFVWNTEFHMTSLNFKKWSESSHSRVRHRALLAVTLCVCLLRLARVQQPRCLRLRPPLELLAGCRQTDPGPSGNMERAASVNADPVHLPDRNGGSVICAPLHFCISKPRIVTRAAERVVLSVAYRLLHTAAQLDWILVRRTCCFRRAENITIVFKTNNHSKWCQQFSLLQV